MICRSGPRKVLRTLEKRPVRERMSERVTECTYPKDIRDRRPAFACMGCYKAGENKSTSVSVRSTEKFISGLPSRTPPDMSGGNSAIRMVSYTADKVPRMAYRICDGYSVVDKFVDTWGCMNDPRNKEGRMCVGI